MMRMNRVLKNGKTSFNKFYKRPKSRNCRWLGFDNRKFISARLDVKKRRSTKSHVDNIMFIYKHTFSLFK